jgi:hypothetical protein
MANGNALSGSVVHGSLSVILGNNVTAYAGGGGGAGDISSGGGGSGYFGQQLQLLHECACPRYCYLHRIGLTVIACVSLY